MQARGGRAAGASLIELMVGLGVLAGLLLLAVPSFGDWIRNTRLRSTAESLRAGLQTARSEAIRRNAHTRLQLVTSLDGSCALSNAGPYWVVNLGTTQSPAQACGNAISSTVSPYLLQKSPVISSSSADVTLTATRPAIAFDGLGRQSKTSNPDTEIRTLTVELKSASGSCVAANGSGSVRCLNVLVSPSGDARICDPARSASATDPMTC